MTQEKMKSLTAYQSKLQDQLKSQTPVKHKDHPTTHVNYLKNELRIVTAQLDAAKLEGVK